MRIIFIIFLGLHSLIHLPGFLKSFGYAELKELTLGISRPFGLLWLVAFFLFSVTTLSFAFKWNLWWLLAFVSVCLSQFLIIYFWKDARFGTIANAIILVVALFGFVKWGFLQKFKQDVSQGMTQEAYFGPSLLMESDISNLPVPVQHYLRYTGSVGKPKINRFKVKLSGKIRANDQAEWMPFNSIQYNFMNNPARLFFMDAAMKNIPVAGYHRYMNEQAFMDIRLLSLVKVQYMDGGDMDISETVTFFNDMCCLAPATLIDKRIKWLDVEGKLVNASFTNNNITIHASLYFDEEGKLVNFISNDRVNFDAGKKMPWSTPIESYGEKKGYILPQKCEAVYQYPDKKMAYGEFVVEEVSYN